jgi:hypothetical protein
MSDPLDDLARANRAISARTKRPEQLTDADLAGDPVEGEIEESPREPLAVQYIQKNYYVTSPRREEPRSSFGAGFFGFFGVLAAIAVVYFTVYGTSQIRAMIEPPRQGPGGISLYQYEMIQPGTSYARVAEYLGQPGTVDSSASLGKLDRVTRVWANPDGSRLIVVFLNDAVSSKAQERLK